MAGNRESGIKSAIKIKKKFGEDHFKNIGRSGGLKAYRNGSLIHGFKKNDEHTRAAGRLGGKISKRGPAKRESN